MRDDLHRQSLVVDAHAHGLGFVPEPARSLYRFLNRRTMPPDLGFDALAPAGVDAVVAKAVGDPIVTRWYRGGPWAAVQAQLDRLERQAADAGGLVVDDAGGVRRARELGTFAVILGLEGADAIGDDTGRLDVLRARGVRVVVPVHLGDNQLGTTCLPWQRYVGPLPVLRRQAEGLTALGRAAVRRMHELGIVVDVAHADRRTLLDVVAENNGPVISSHTGARALQDFARFLSDEEARAVAGTGGVVGLWPYRYGRKGVPTLAALVDHAHHLAALVGPEHLCIGTDMNGVPGVMEGYRDERDLPLVTGALLDAGFGEADVRGILGENFLRVLDATNS